MNIALNELSFQVKVSKEGEFYEAFIAKSDSPIFRSRTRRRAIAYALEWLSQEYMKQLTTPVDGG